jgi:competence protein ComEC
MTRQLKTLIWMMGLLIILGIAAAVLQPSQRQGTGSIAMLNIGQGDGFLITAPSGAQMLIDGGKDSKVLTELAQAMPRGDRTIDIVLATHPDADHIGGLKLVLSRYKVGIYLTSQVTSDSTLFKDINTVLVDENIPAYYVRKGMTIALDSTTKLTVLFPDRDTSGWETNTASVVSRLDMGASSALLTGDSPISIEQYLLKTNKKALDVDILKLGHHGSKTSSSEEYLKATSPTLALISAGVNNSYGHPHKEVTDLLKKLRIPSVSTQDNGTVTLYPSGDGWRREVGK